MRIQNLAQRLRAASAAYYNGTPLMSDAEFDALEAELRKIDPHNPVFAEAVYEIAGHLEGSAIDADVLAHQEDALIAFHRLRKGLLHGLGITQFTDGHAAYPGE